MFFIFVKIQAISPKIIQNHKMPARAMLKPLPYDTFSFSGTIAPKPKATPKDDKELRFREYVETTAERVTNSEEFLNWANKIDYKKLTQVAPAVDDFHCTQFEDFLTYHFKIGTKEFTKENLSCKDFENILARDLISANELASILTLYPATKRAIGELPSGWGKGEEQFDKVVGAINKITENIDMARDTRFYPSEMNFISQTLFEALGKDVSCQYIGRGAYGHAIKINIKGVKPVVLKLFKSAPKYLSESHGAGFEPQAGFYARANNLPNYARFHFGQVSNKRELGGFYVADYIDSKPNFREKSKMENLGLYLMDIADACSSNIINGKIVDYGSSSLTVDPKVFKIAEEIVEKTADGSIFGLRSKNVTEYLTQTYRNLSGVDKLNFMEAVNFIAFNANEPFNREFERWLIESRYLDGHL